MGLVHAAIKLDNPQQVAIASISTQALLDTGALHLCIPAAMSRQLNLVAERVASPSPMAAASKRLTSAPCGLK